MSAERPNWGVFAREYPERPVPVIVAEPGPPLVQNLTLALVDGSTFAMPTVAEDNWEARVGVLEIAIPAALRVMTAELEYAHARRVFAVGHPEEQRLASAVHECRKILRERLARWSAP